MLDLTFYKYEFEQINNTLKDIQYPKIMIFIKLLYIYNGVIRIQFNDNHKTIYFSKSL